MNETSTKAMRHRPPASARATPARWQWEALALLGLAALLAFFLKTSWRKWPDPIVDFGQQCYCFWRVSQGALLYHDFLWNYGPLSACFNAGLFRCFGPGIMVLVIANLIVYAGILLLAYLAFRRAWGWLGACAALAVFISLFSFSHLLAVGNYNYVTPYSAEATHGMLLILVTAFIAVRWSEKSSLAWALALGLCGGLSAVIKPEFMLATGILGLAAYALRWAQGQRVTLTEHMWLIWGLTLPTLSFAVSFARGETWREAFIDASSAWWLVVVEQIQRTSSQQQVFSGFNHPAHNVMIDLKATGGALGLMALAWVAGWFMNRNWPALMRLVTALAAIILAGLFCQRINWLDSGRCLPGLMLAILLLVTAKLAGELRRTRSPDRSTVMQLFLVLLGGTMLARMALYPHVFHLGFFQAALAGMIVAAVMVSMVPRWNGTDLLSNGVTTCVMLCVLAVACGTVAAKSLDIRKDQIQSVGTGRDQFYSTRREIDGTGVLVDWASAQLRSIPPEATVLVLPDGTMINYLSRHKSLEPNWGRSGEEQPLLEAIRRNPPDFVVLITLDLREFGIARYGAPGNKGHDIITWLGDHYWIMSHMGGDPLALDDHPGAVILRRKTK